MDGQEDTVLDAAQVNVLHEGEIIPLPKKLLDVDLKEVVNFGNIVENFTQEEINELMPFLPKQDMQTLKHALEGKGLYEGHL
jgi:hypothetical protein